MTMKLTAEFFAEFGPCIRARLTPAPAPAPNRPDEFWWVEWCEGMPLEPARISFRGVQPHGILEIGSDYEQDLADREVRLVAPVPAYGTDQVVITREEFMTMWDALRWIGREAPSFDWLDALKARVDAQAGEEA